MCSSDLDEKEEVFKRATKAIDEKNWGELFDIADRYDLDLEIGRASCRERV